MDMTSQKPFACKSAGCGMSFTNEDRLTVHEKKHEMILNLGLGSKSANIIADQTPTPTRLIKNCEEVGLFDDLKHVNPFDETFRRAVESKNSTGNSLDTQNITNTESTQPNEQDSLHTPQVFPVIDENAECAQFQMDSAPNIVLPDKILIKSQSRETAQKSQAVRSVKAIKLKRALEITKQHEREILPNNLNQVVISTIPVNIIQPQVITVNGQTISKPFISPKQLTTPATGTHLPIKERLKAILSSTAKRPATSSTSPCIRKRNDPGRTNNDEDDLMERKRAAATRYRHKIKREHTDLRKKLAELSAENLELKAIVKDLRLTLAKHQNCNVTLGNASAGCSAPEIQIPPVRLVMNIPKMIIKPSGQTILRNPVTLSMEKDEEVIVPKF